MQRDREILNGPGPDGAPVEFDQGEGRLAEGASQLHRAAAGGMPAVAGLDGHKVPWVLAVEQAGGGQTVDPVVAQVVLVAHRPAQVGVGHVTDSRGLLALQELGHQQHVQHLRGLATVFLEQCGEHARRGRPSPVQAQQVAQGVGLV